MPVGSHAAAFADGARYEATLGHSHRYYMRVKAEHLRRILARHRPAARRLLDLGCGTGEMAEALAPAGFETTGVDLSPAMVDHARTKNIPRARFLAADAAATGLPGGAFDAAFATALYHHVPPPQRPAVTRELVRLLAPGGLAVVFEHNPANPVTRRSVRTCPVDEDAVLLTAAECRNHLADAGLRILERRYLLFFPRPLAALRGLERGLGWLPLGGQYVVIAERRADGGGPA